jgi:hypothetical protein
LLYLNRRTSNMQKIKIFLASPNELKPERDRFEQEIYRKSKDWADKDIYLHLDIWEDLSARMSATGSQSEYNKFVKGADLFVLLVWSKLGMYSAEEFETAFGQFKNTQKPFIYVYFKLPVPTDAAESLTQFKKKLEGLQHFPAHFDHLDSLWNQFNKELDRIVENSVVIQSVSHNTITVGIGGGQKEIAKTPEALQAAMDSVQALLLSINGRLYGTSSLGTGNFSYLLGQVGGRALPAELRASLEDSEGWIASLQDELAGQGVTVGSKPLQVFGKYGWLIETFLQKMSSDVGKERNIRRLSFMAEAYQASLRYLCYIQVSQLLQQKDLPRPPLVEEFIHIGGKAFLQFDYTSLLLIATEALGQKGFVTEIQALAAELNDSGSELYATALYLEDQRLRLLHKDPALESGLEPLLDEYLTALVCWLRRLSFLAHYRMVSVKEINISYRMGTNKKFAHFYGELHSTYSEMDVEYSEKRIDNFFTYNQSVLLFKGSDVAICMDSIGKESGDAYISLSPLVIDQSVFYDKDKQKQTPEIFYYTGCEKDGQQYHFAQHKNELELEGEPLQSNKWLEVQKQNSKQYRLNELYTHLQLIFSPAKAVSP